MWRAFKNFLLKLLLDEETKRSIIEKEIDFKIETDEFTPEETEDLWRRIANREPLLIKWIEWRKNFLLKQVLIKNINSDHLRAIVLEWEIIKKIIEKSVPQKGQIPKEQELRKPEDVEEIKQKLKKMVGIKRE